MNLEKERSVLIEASKKASKILKKYYGSNKFRQKSNKTLVSMADIEANKAIISTIKKKFPEHTILSEETGLEDNKSDFKWVIDPVDGTHNYLRQIPIFGSSIALEYKNEIVLGILDFPALRLTAIAEKNKGAFLNGKRIQVSGKNELDHSILLVEFSYSKRPEKVKFMEKLVNTTIDMRYFGAIIYELLLIANGTADGLVIYATNEWDVAAGFIMVEEAGGKITDFENKPYDFSNNQYVISNRKLHNSFIRMIKK